MIQRRRYIYSITLALLLLFVIRDTIIIRKSSDFGEGSSTNDCFSGNNSPSNDCDDDLVNDHQNLQKDDDGNIDHRYRRGTVFRSATNGPVYSKNLNPSAVPSSSPSSTPSLQPSDRPSIKSSIKPSTTSLNHPSSMPGSLPTSSPSSKPSLGPSISPSFKSSSTRPTVIPSATSPSSPSSFPSNRPTERPSARSSLVPLSTPSYSPMSVTSTILPSSSPSLEPPSLSSLGPSSLSTLQPSIQPTARPIINPTSIPSSSPSFMPSSNLTGGPSVKPPLRPSNRPSLRLSTLPTVSPSLEPSLGPSLEPSSGPSSGPSSSQSLQPSLLTTTTMQPSLQSSAFADTFPDRNLVLDLMQLSYDVYAVDEPDISASDAITDPKFEEALWIEAKFSTEVMIVKSREDQDFPPIVVFRGSEELDDWKVNTNFGLVKSKFQNAPDSVEMHQGFQNALFNQEDVIGKVEEKVLELIGESGEVIVTGHSSGGTYAHICAVYLTDKYPNMKAKMINFGAPRFGNEYFKSWTEESLANLSAWRFVYRSDAVPRIIPKSRGYRHAGHLFAIYRYESEVYYHQNGGGEDYEEAPLRWYFATSIRHHLQGTYLDFFKKNINTNKFWPNDFMRVP